MPEKVKLFSNGKKYFIFTSKKTTSDFGSVNYLLINHRLIYNQLVGFPHFNVKKAVIL